MAKKYLTSLEKLKNARSKSRSFTETERRYSKYREQIYPNGNHLHSRAYNAAYSTMCQIPPENDGLPNWKCALKCCTE